jgi:ribonuclease J
MNPDRPDRPEKEEPALHWHLLGGNNKNRIGANSSICSYAETNSLGERKTTRILFDAGVLMGDARYPEYPELSACDTIVADYSRYLKKRGADGTVTEPPEPLDAIFLTHNHSDHMGAIAFMLLQGYELPKIYGTPYTLKRLEQDLLNSGLDPDEWPEMLSIAPGKPTQEGALKVNAFWVSHSTPQSVGYFIESPVGNILHPGDFKLDSTVVWGPSWNEEQFKKTVNKPVDLLLLDSTGADRDVPLTTEEDVRETLHELMEQNPRKRFIIAVMSGYEENVASVAKVTAEDGRTLWISGWAHEQALSALKETGLSLSDTVGTPLEVRMLDRGKAAKDLAESKPGDNVVIVTGAAGQPNSTLPRAAEGNHPSLKLDKKTDIIVFCAPSIPGQESSRERLLSVLRTKGFTVLTKADFPLYSQAHARLPELMQFAAMVKPKTVLPIHGDTHLRNANKEALEKAGATVIAADNGDVLKVTRDGVTSTNPATKGKPKLIGFKTLQGQNWNDRNYMQINAPQEKPNDQPAPANSNTKVKRPKIFNVNPK